MNKYIKTTIVFIGIWFTAALLNGLLSGITITVIENSSLKAYMGNIFLSVIFSFVFSMPLVGLVWFVTIINQFLEKKGHELLQVVLGTALMCALIGAILFINTLGTEFRNARYIVGLCICISAMTSILIFRKQIKENA